MIKLSALLLAGLTFTAVAAPAHATIYAANFTGSVSTSINTSLAIGNTVSGSFVYDSASAAYTSFKVDGFSATAPFTSYATVSPGGTSNPVSAFFSAAQSVVQGTGTVNRTFTLDLEALNNFNGPSALAILSTPGLFAQLDTVSFPSNFSYVTSPGNGTPTTNLTATLTSLSTTVPEPASMALLAVPMLGMALRRRRRG